MKLITLREFAHTRSGEKGNDSNVSVIAYDQATYDILRDQVTVDAVKRLYGSITKGRITRYEVPRIAALNFVLENVLVGGRSRTLAFEESGKALSTLLLTMEIEVPDSYVERSVATRRIRGELPAAGSGGLPPVVTSGAKTVRLGCAAGWSRDRYEPALDLVLNGDIDYLCFDAMSEVTMSAAQVARMEGGTGPLYDPSLEARMEPILAECKRRGVKIVTNAGWLNPAGAAEMVRALARRLSVDGLKVAAVEGGILTDSIVGMNLAFIETGQAIAARKAEIVSAETYLGAEGIIDALRQGADVVITTRVADGCVYLAPLAHEFGWSIHDAHLMARGMIVGHLMECGTQISGGYFADPGYKDVPNLVDVGNPIADVSEERIVITKIAGSGGVISEATCKEQLLYEVQDPSRYLCPDVIADLTKVSFREVGVDAIEVIVDNAGLPKTSTFKALVGLKEGYMTEEMVLFAGPGAMAKAELTEALLRERFRRVDLRADELRFDYVGLNSIHREATPPWQHEPYEVILRIAVKTPSRSEADKIRREVDPLAVNGAAGTGKWATSSPGSRVRTIIGLSSVLVPRELIEVSVDVR